MLTGMERLFLDPFCHQSYTFSQIIDLGILFYFYNIVDNLLLLKYTKLQIVS